MDESVNSGVFVTLGTFTVVIDVYSGVSCFLVNGALDIRLGGINMDVEEI